MPNKSLHLFINVKDTCFSIKEMYMLAPGKHLLHLKEMTNTVSTNFYSL